MLLLFGAPVSAATFVVDSTADSIDVPAGTYVLSIAGAGENGAATGDQIGTSGAPIDPLLGPLTAFANGTFGHKPQPESPLLDQGNPAVPGSGGAACLATDQRGQTRPQNGDGVPGARCDIGSVEKLPPASCGLAAELALIVGGLAARRRLRGERISAGAASRER